MELKGAIMDASKKSPPHLVQAFEPRAGLVLGQVEVDGKSNEITAIPALMEMLDLAGRTAAADAMHSQCETSRGPWRRAETASCRRRAAKKRSTRTFRSGSPIPRRRRKWLLVSMLTAVTGGSRRASRRSRTMSAGYRIGMIGPASRPAARSMSFAN